MARNARVLGGFPFVVWNAILQAGQARRLPSHHGLAVTDVCFSQSLSQVGLFSLTKTGYLDTPRSSRLGIRSSE